MATLPAAMAAAPALENLYAAFRLSVARYPDKAALRYKGEDGAYRDLSFAALDGHARLLASSLAQLGVGKGDRVAIFAYHGPEWVIADLAILKLGAVVVPLYHTLSPAAVRYILQDSGSKLVFVENRALLDVVERVRVEVPSLAHVVSFSGQGAERGGPCLPFWELAAGNPPPGKEQAEDPHPVARDDAATIVYTSGTTGEPKGVVLSHGNILFNAFSAIERFRVRPQDAFLSFLPLCHMFEKTCGNYTMLFAGAAIAYAGDLTTIVQDVQAIRPTVLIVVPRVVEKIYQAVEQKVMEGPFIKKRLVLAAVRDLNERANRAYRGQRVPLPLRARCAFYDRVVAARFRQIAGGRLRLLVSGGAPLDRGLAKTLHVLGFNILEGYGLTETSPIVCTSLLEDNRLGTVGKPFDGVEVRIGDADEILVRGPNLMLGYHNRPVETSRAIDEEGWFHTGDQGKFDEQGNLVITGRLKEMIVTSYGKKVAPGPIEAEIKKSRYIDQVMLCGDNRKYICALIVPRREAIEQHAGSKEIGEAEYARLLESGAIHELLRGEIERATADLAPFEKVKAFTALPEGFTVANELLTPTLKLRRPKIAARYRGEIEALYATGKE